jgi:hypothetical protein
VNIFKKIWSRRHVASLAKNDWHPIIENLVIQSGVLTGAFYSACTVSVSSSSDLNDVKVINPEPIQKAHNILNGFLSAQMLRYIKVANYISPSEHHDFSRQLLGKLAGNNLEDVEEFYKLYDGLLDQNPVSLPATFLTDLFETMVDRQSPVDIAFLFMSQPTYDIFKYFVYFTVSNAFQDKYECEHLEGAVKQYYQNRLYAEYMDKLGLR